MKKLFPALVLCLVFVTGGCDDEPKSNQPPIILPQTIDERLVGGTWNSGSYTGEGYSVSFTETTFTNDFRGETLPRKTYPAYSENGKVYDWNAGWGEFRKLLLEYRELTEAEVNLEIGWPAWYGWETDYENGDVMVFRLAKADGTPGNNSSWRYCLHLWEPTTPP